MALGFLQGFHENTVLGERDLQGLLRRQVGIKAIELAMLGMTAEAHKIISLVHDHGNDLKGVLNRTWNHALDLFYSINGLQQPDGDSLPKSSAELEQMTSELVKKSTYHVHKKVDDVDFDNVTVEGYKKLSMALDAMKAQRFAHATSGYQALLISQTLMGLLYMALALDRREDVNKLIHQMALRIHANGQAEYFCPFRNVWKDYFLPSQLRETLQINEDDLKEYAEIVYSTTKTRLENGPCSPDEMYANLSLTELLTELDRNTLLDTTYDPEEFGEEPYETIKLEPASITEISAAEEKIGRPLPHELKAFYQLSNGTRPTPIGGLPGFRKRILVPIDDMFLEKGAKADFMTDYKFYLIPDTDIELYEDKNEDEDTIWPGMYDGGIAMYEHDGQGTDYTWIFQKAFIDDAKRRLQVVYNTGTNKRRAVIDEAIRQHYGSREIYDNMEYCIYVQGWGEPTGQRIYPSYRSYLNAVLYDSRPIIEKSPLKVSSEDI